MARKFQLVVNKCPFGPPFMINPRKRAPAKEMRDLFKDFTAALTTTEVLTQHLLHLSELGHIVLSLLPRALQAAALHDIVIANRAVIRRCTPKNLKILMEEIKDLAAQIAENETYAEMMREREEKRSYYRKTPIKDIVMAQMKK